MNSTSPGIPGFETLNTVTQGRSSVLRARRDADGREVILKLIDPASEAILPKRFDRTRRTLARLAERHLGILPVLDQGIAPDGRTYLVLPHLPLGSLDDHMVDAPMPWHLAGHLIHEVVEIVGRAHDEGVVFGDLRPSKILLENPSRPVVSAFGMATRRFDDGRPSFRPPEADNDLAPTATGDAYSLALIFGALVAGGPKEPDEHLDRFLGRIANLVPPQILDVLEHGLAESHSNRYRSAAAMNRALGRALAEVAGPHEDRMPSIHDELARRLAPGGSTGAGIDAVEADVSRSWSLDEDDPDGDVFDPTATAELTLDPSPDPVPAVQEDDDPGAAGDEDGAADLDATGIDEVVNDELANDGVVNDDPTGEVELPTPTEVAAAPADVDLDDLLPPGLDDLVLAPPSERREESYPALSSSDDHDDFLAELLAGGDEDGAGHESNDGQRNEVTASAAEQEIVDLTELFTRTQEFVYESTTDSGQDTVDAMGSGRSAIITRAPLPPGAPDLDGDDVVDDDPTDIFPGAAFDDDDGDRGMVGPGPAAPPWIDDQPEALPFPNAGRVRPGEAATGSWAQAREWAEMAWFRSRRTVSTLAALIGLLAIVAIVVFFAARGIRSTTSSVETEGVPQQSTTATSSPDFSATDAPFITDVPPSFQPTTATTAPRRRPATTAAAPTSSSTASTVDEVTPPTSGSSATTDPPSTTSGDRTTATKPGRGRGRTTTTTRATTATTTTSGGSRTSEVLPPPTGAALALREPASPPKLTAPQVLSVSRSAATIVYRSDECVATRFRLTGSDGSSQSGTSTGYDATVQCSAAWNLDFTGSSGLAPGVSYTLAVSIRNTAGLVASSSVDFTTPA